MPGKVESRKEKAEREKTTPEENTQVSTEPLEAFSQRTPQLPHIAEWLRLGVETNTKIFESMLAASVAGTQAATQQFFDNFMRILDLSSSLTERLTRIHREYLEAHQQMLPRIISVVEQYSGSIGEHFAQEVFAFVKHWHQVLENTLRQGYRSLEDVQKAQFQLMEEFFKTFSAVYGSWMDALSRTLKQNTELLQKFHESPTSKSER